MKNDENKHYDTDMFLFHFGKELCWLYFSLADRI